MSTCRVCKGWSDGISPMFKYGVRHYAHGRCGLAKFGAKFLDMIPAHEIGRLPYVALDKAGLVAEVERRIEAREAS